ncbi:hypothetical protein D5086_017128 [Populus alba]|uniref:Uncharacterized protein n=1 Tax=Populus alba TaxID=43335 RepID=A0ACC4BX30_POPAL
MTTKMLSLYSTTMTEKMPYLSTINPHFSIISLKKKSFPVTGSRNLFTTTAHASRFEVDHQISRSQGHEEESLLLMRSVLGSMERVYLKRNPTAKAILDLVKSVDDADHICYDHLAFRTFGVKGHGIESMASFFLDYGYKQQEELKFPAKKLKALWFSPPSGLPHEDAATGSGVNGPLPRIFISELLVDQLSPQAQVSSSSDGWESEYAAWTLVNGYALNHVTISTHRLKTHLTNIRALNQFLQENGFNLNSEGGVLKVSPDGLLLQSSTVADSIPFKFSDGFTESVPCSYIEFAERLVLPQYKNLLKEEVKEFHRRDGFEVGNADKIFESTSKEQLTRRTG